MQRLRRPSLALSQSKDWPPHDTSTFFCRETLQCKVNCRRVVEGRAKFSVAIAEGGLFIDIARECRTEYGPGCELWFLCGRDAAERIVNWDYGAEDPFAAQLNEFGLLVADRQGYFDPLEPHRERIRPLKLAGDWNELSATEVRERLRAGEAPPRRRPCRR